MNKSKLAKAVATAVAGTALSLSSIVDASASTTMYNTFNAGTSPGNGTTDGWTWSDGSAKGTTIPDPDAEPPVPAPTLVPWVRSAGYNTNPNDPRPFNYTGSSALNWAAHLTKAGDSLEISREDSGINADIDTAGGAWQDKNKTGWAHNTDIGLFKSDVTTDVTLKLSAVNGPIAQFGITVFTGMDTGTGYSHHTAWNNPPTLPFTTDNPFFTAGVDYVGGLGVNTAANASYLFGVNSTNGFTFTAQAGQIYSIYLGGYGGQGWNDQHDRYRLSISSVPVPAAVWFMGSGLMGLLAFGRRKTVAASAI